MTTPDTWAILSAFRFDDERPGRLCPKASQDCSNLRINWNLAPRLCRFQAGGFSRLNANQGTVEIDLVPRQRIDLAATKASGQGKKHRQEGWRITFRKFALRFAQQRLRVNAREVTCALLGEELDA
jgi:hypothetical protein